MNAQIAQRVDAFFTQFKQVTCKKGVVIIPADQNPDGVYYLQEGQVKVYALSRDGHEQVLNIFKPISFFPMSWAVNNTPNKYFYETLTPVRMWKAPPEAVLEFVKKDTEVLFNLLQRVYRGIDGVMERLDSWMSGNAYSQLIILLIIYAKRFGKKNGSTITVDTSEHELAIGVGIARETTSRELKKLKDKKLVQFEKNRLTIPNLALLEKEVA